MQIESLKELEKLIKLCRKQGLSSIKIDNIEFQLGSLPDKPRKSVFSDLELPPEAKLTVPQFKSPVQAEAEKIATDALTEEQMLMWSARSEDPSFKDNQ
jgi:hypothetical protein